MANKFSKLNIRDTIVSGSGRVWKKLSTIFPLSTPAISLDGDIFTITDTSGVATSFDILVGGVVVTTITSNTFDLSALGLADGVYSISAIAKASGYFDSAQSNAITYVKNIGNYIAFSSPSSFTLNIVDNTKYWDGILEYSTDTSTWNEWDGTSTLSSDNGVLYMRGTGNTYITGSTAYYAAGRWRLTGGKISCVGNIENLLDYTIVANGEHPSMANNCYYYMFYGCTSLTTAPALPATTLARACYSHMFCNCVSLAIAPELPATTLADSCYSDMFCNCTSLTTAPALPATTLAGSCYSHMFYGCTSLTTAPELPATALAWDCYEYMFESCTSLTTAPELPATALADSCYSYMFKDCTSLTTAPALPATTLRPHCYQRMFYGCTSLTTAPALPATTLAWACYSCMFEGCTSLTTAPELPATALTDYCYECMFCNCTSLKLSAQQSDKYTIAYRIPTSGTGTIATNSLTGMFTLTGGIFTGTPEIDTTYYLHSSNSVV